MPETIETREYLDAQKNSPYGGWFDELNAPAAAKVATAITRMRQGNFGDHKSVGSGVLERRIDFGAGYRVYYAKDGAALVILLGGGTKDTQQQDINDSITRWTDYKQRKKKEEAAEQKKHGGKNAPDKRF